MSCVKEEIQTAKNEIIQGISIIEFLYFSIPSTSIMSPLVKTNDQWQETRHTCKFGLLFMLH